MIVALLAEKGGTGKTALATNLAGMRSRNRRVLLIDADRQGREASNLWWVIMLRYCWYATCCPSRCSM